MTPMTDERLAEIHTLLDDTEQARERLHGIMGAPDRPRAPVLQACHDLAAEVERLRDLARWLAAEVPDWHTGVALHAKARELLGLTDEDE